MHLASHFSDSLNLSEFYMIFCMPYTTVDIRDVVLSCICPSYTETVIFPCIQHTCFITQIAAIRPLC